MPFKPSTRWSVYSFAIISFYTSLQIAALGLFPIFIDIYYHLAVASGFNAAGGYVSHNFWEYAPMGRPHLYPPLLHILILFFYKLGLSHIGVAKLLSLIIFPLALLTIWFFIRSLFNERLAFFSCLVASSIPTFYTSSLSMMPATVSILCGLLSFVCIEKKRTVAAILLLAYSFYLHGLICWVITLSFLIFAIFNKKERFKLALVVICGVILASPILIHQYSKRAFFHIPDVLQDYQTELSILTLIFAAIGLAVAGLRKGIYHILISFNLALLILLPVHRYRYFSGEGIFGLIPLAAIGLDYFWNRMPTSKKSILYIITVAILFSALSPSLSMNKAGNHFNIFDSTLVNMVSAFKIRERANAQSIYFQKFYDDIVASVKENSSDDDIIYSNFDCFAGAVSVLSGRAISNAMLKEVRPLRAFDPVSVASLVIWLKDPDAPAEEPYSIIKKHNLKKIKETEIAFIYKNPNASAKRQVAKPIIPTAIIFTIFFISIGLIVFDLLRLVRIYS